MKTPLLDGKRLVWFWALALLACSPQPPASSPISNDESETNSRISDAPGEWNENHQGTKVLETQELPLTLTPLAVEGTMLESESLTLELSAPIVSMASEGGVLFVATESEVYQVLGENASPMSYIWEEGAPEELGTILQLYSRSGGVLIQTTKGLFEVYDWAIVYFPLNVVP